MSMCPYRADMLTQFGLDEDNLTMQVGAGNFFAHASSLQLPLL